jgi:hypothetical protein
VGHGRAVHDLRAGERKGSVMRVSTIMLGRREAGKRSAPEEPKVCRLSAGGNGIRTLGPPRLGAPRPARPWRRRGPPCRWRSPRSDGREWGCRRRTSRGGRGARPTRGRFRRQGLDEGVQAWRAYHAALAGGDDDVKIRCRHQTTDQAAAKNARSSNDRDGTCHGHSSDGSSSTKRAAIADVGTRQLSFRPNRRYRLRAILS